MDVCFICAKSLDSSEIVEVKEKGVKTLLARSIERGRKDHETILKKVNTIKIHQTGRKVYSKPLSKAARDRVHQGEPSTSHSIDEYSTPESESVPVIPVIFDFENHCIICSEKFTSEEKPSAVQNPSVRNSLSTLLKERHNNDNEWIELRRILKHVPDLVAVGAKYHQQCKSNLFFKRTTPKVSNKTHSSHEVTESIKFIYDYIDENPEECQYLISDLTAKIQGEYVPQNRTIISHLQANYKDNVSFFERHGKPTIVCFRNAGYEVLAKRFYEGKKLNKKEERERESYVKQLRLFLRISGLFCVILMNIPRVTISSNKLKTSFQVR